MNNLLELMINRRSVRKYSDVPVNDEQIKTITTAALLSPSGHSKYPCKLYDCFYYNTDRWGCQGNEMEGSGQIREFINSGDSPLRSAPPPAPYTA